MQWYINEYLKKITEQIYSTQVLYFLPNTHMDPFKTSDVLAAENFLASTMMPILIARELIILQKYKCKLLYYTLILNLVLLNTSFL